MKGKDPDGWYFVLPDVPVYVNGKRYEGVAIRLREGVAIEWNGRMLRHGSTNPTSFKGEVLGTWFGMT